MRRSPRSRHATRVITGPTNDPSACSESRPRTSSSVLLITCDRSLTDRLTHSLFDLPGDPLTIESVEQVEAAIARLKRDDPVDAVIMCALVKVHEFSGCDTRPASLAPAGSTWGGPGGDKWPEALQEKPS